MIATEQKVLRFIKENDLIKSNDKILIALSGGPDSIFLLHFLNKFKNKFKINLIAVHINHLLRGKESDRDELFCAAVCNELDIPYYSLRKNVKGFAKKNKVSIEMAARKIRYSVFNKLAEENSFDKITTAHVADDNVETVFLNLIKGAGLNGIAGIPVKREKIIRPILCLTKSEILAYLDLIKFEYRIDKSNLSNDYERNFLRNDIIPSIKKKLNPSLEKAILNTTLNLQGLIDELSLGIESPDLMLKDNEFVQIPVQFFFVKDLKTSLHHLKNNIDKTFNIKLSKNDIKKIFALSSNQSGKSEELSFGLIAIRKRETIVVKLNNDFREQVNEKIKTGEKIKIGERTLIIEKVKPAEAIINSDPNQEFISADEILNYFYVRNWKDGDKFQPIGMKGTKNVSDYLNDIKMDSFDKKNQLVLTNNKKIVWVIGKRLDERFKITESTKKALKLCLK